MKKVIKLEQHQLDMSNITNKINKGILQSPTGSGKTFAQADIVKRTLNKGFSVTLIKTPRIGLSNQLAKSYTKYLSDVDMNSYLTFLAHSGDDADISGGDNLSPEELLEQMLTSVTSIDAYTSIFEMILKIERAKELSTNEDIMIKELHSKLN
jgi:superfamily II DNA or RNA helicase